MNTRRFKPYPACKDSGVEWLGEIPAHWEVRRLKAVASVQLSNVDKKSVDGQVHVRLCNYTDVYYHHVQLLPPLVGNLSFHGGFTLLLLSVLGLAMSTIGKIYSPLH